MSSVWYTGSASTREIDSARWTAIGLPHADSVWDSSNGWSIPAADFSDDQLALLERLGDFFITPIDDVRPDPFMPLDSLLATEEYVNDVLEDAIEEFADTVGPPGPPGPTGPAGPAGTGVGAYTYEQGTPSSSWLITHNLGYPPAGVRVLDSGGNEWEGLVSYPDPNNVLQIDFNIAFGGTAYLS